MNGWRVGYVLGLLIFVVTPLLMPLAELLAPAAWQWSTDDAARLSHLAINTLLLMTGTVLISIPLGTCLAVIFFRTSLPGRSAGIFLLAMALFVPLPIFVSAWQGVLGADGLAPTDFWRDAPGRRWASGLPAAIWIHAVAATPWVAFLVGIGLAWVEPELEEEAAQSVGPWRVLALVTLPRVRASILGAGLFVAIQTASEVCVTDMMLVSTLADEMRTQFAIADAALARTLILSLPILFVSWVMVLGLMSYLERSLPPLTVPARRSPYLDFGPDGVRIIIAVVMLAVLLLPLGSLVWKLGLSGYPGQWTAGTAQRFLAIEGKLLGGQLLASVALALTTGLAVAVVALVGCGLARNCGWFRWLFFAVAMWIWVLPGPAVGMALHGIFKLMPTGPLQMIFWDGPSPAPLVWAQGVRALPIAVIFLWPVVRMIPRELFEEARLGGAGPVSEFLHVVWPLAWRATLVTGIAAAALCLGEVGASGRVSTPGWESFAQMLFDRMHTGVDNNVAALCVLLLAAIGGVAVLGGIASLASRVRS